MKIFKKQKNKIEGTPEPWSPGIPKPHEEPKPKRLEDFLHGEELIGRLERNRRQRRKWAEEILGIEQEEWWKSED